MATKLRVHQQHPSLSVLALGHISEIARPKRKCTGTVRHQPVPRDVPMDSLGLAEKPNHQDAVRLAGVGPTTRYLVLGRPRCRRSPMGPTLAGLPLRGLPKGPRGVRPWSQLKTLVTVIFDFYY